MQIDFSKYKNIQLPKFPFLHGMGSIFNIFGSQIESPYQGDPQEEDAKAIRSDWEAALGDWE